jgi:Tfp pilus assembly protein PilP
MSRLRSLLLLGGTVLVMSYISAPAAPTPAPARTPETMPVIDESAPAARAATQETARLRARLAIVPEKPVTQRDPFSFGTKSRVPKRATAAPEPEAVIEVAPPLPLAWPRLVALLTDNGKITAVLGVGDGVEMLKAGETAGGFLVREITSTSIEVVHVATSAATRLTLR